MTAVMAERKKKPGDAKRTQVSVHMTPELLAALDRFIAAQEVRPERPAVCRTALEQFLAAKGFWKPA